MRYVSFKIFLIFCLNANTCSAQSDFDSLLVLPPSLIENVIEKYTDSLLLNGFDTTISFSCQRCFGTGLYDKNANVIDDASLIVAFSGKKLEIVKFVYATIDSLKIRGVGISQKIKIKNYDTLQLFRRLTKPAEEEVLAPYVYQIKLNGQISCQPFRYSHPEVNTINIKSRSHRKYLNIEMNSLKEKYFDIPDAPINVNYEYNKSLNIYSLHSLLIGLSSHIFSLKPL